MLSKTSIVAIVALLAVGAAAAAAEQELEICSSEYTGRPSQSDIESVYTKYLSAFADNEQLRSLVQESYDNFEHAVKESARDATQMGNVLDQHNVRVCAMHSMIKGLLSSVQ